MFVCSRRGRRKDGAVQAARASWRALDNKLAMIRVMSKNIRLRRTLMMRMKLMMKRRLIKAVNSRAGEQQLATLSGILVKFGIFFV